MLAFSHLNAVIAVSSWKTNWSCITASSDDNVETDEDGSALACIPDGNADETDATLCTADNDFSLEDFLLVPHNRHNSLTTNRYKSH